MFNSFHGVVMNVVIVCIVVVFLLVVVIIMLLLLLKVDKLSLTTLILFLVWLLLCSLNQIYFCWVSGLINNNYKM